MPPFLLGIGARLIGFGGIIKANPIKSIAIASVIGLAIGSYFLGRHLVNDYTSTKNAIVALQVSNDALQSTIDLLQETNTEITNRVADLETSQTRIQGVIDESRRQVDNIRNDLDLLNLEEVASEDPAAAEAELNRVWVLSLECIESASRLEDNENCETLLLPQD